MHSHIVLFSLLILGLNFSSQAQAPNSHVSPWAPAELGVLPPVSSLTNGVWLKGELHLLSCRSPGADPSLPPGSRLDGAQRK